MERYSILPNREIVLLKSTPCFWGKCIFCDYIKDNSADTAAINRINREILDQVTGKKRALEVINSGSCFELPVDTLSAIKEVIVVKNINKLYLESHWQYRSRLAAMRDFMEIPIIFKVGIETFDDDFRNKVLNKGTYFQDVAEVRAYFDSPCLLVGIKGQTEEMISKDIELLIKHFNYGTVNVFTENTTAVQRDTELIKWFSNKYGNLKKYPDIDVLYHNTDFGVGERKENNNEQ